MLFENHARERNVIEKYDCIIKSHDEAKLIILERSQSQCRRLSNDSACYD
jgi:hypothetical protein